jgi:hypothetical protein
VTLQNLTVAGALSFGSLTFGSPLTVPNGGTGAFRLMVAFTLSAAFVCVALRSLRLASKPIVRTE